MCGITPISGLQIEMPCRITSCTRVSGGINLIDLLALWSCFAWIKHSIPGIFPIHIYWISSHLDNVLLVRQYFPSVGMVRNLPKANGIFLPSFSHHWILVHTSFTRDTLTKLLITGQDREIVSQHRKTLKHFDYLYLFLKSNPLYSR